MKLTGVYTQAINIFTINIFLCKLFNNIRQIKVSNTDIFYAYNG